MSLYLGSTPIANTGYDKANTSLSNLTSIGKNIANWSNNVTNCITEIPQDIKLELSNGTLTLKAGSKVTYPDGTQITISTDETIPTHSADGEYVCVRHKVSGEYSFLKSLCYSGTTAPTGFVGNAVWFDTTNNIIKNSVDSGATWENSWSLPVGIVTQASGAYTSIDQVFNGFGYIGSTVFALPGVKGLIPNGRNADGSLKNTEFTIPTVKTITRDINGGEFVWAIRQDGEIEAGYNYFTSSEIQPTSGFHLWYKPSENIIYRIKAGLLSGKILACIGGSEYRNTTSPYKVERITPKTPFHAVDYNDAVLQSSLATCHVVVETYVNGTSWYRVYDDGWVEQGGYSLYDSANPTNPRTVTLLKTMANTNYTITNSTDNAWSSNPLIYSRIACVYSKATTNFQMTGVFSNGAGTDYSFYWQVSGQGA